MGRLIRWRAYVRVSMAFVSAGWLHEYAYAGVSIPPDAASLHRASPARLVAVPDPGENEGRDDPGGHAMPTVAELPQVASVIDEAELADVGEPLFEQRADHRRAVSPDDQGGDLRRGLQGRAD